MAGTLFGLPLSQPIKLTGKPEVGCKLYIYEAGTFTSPVTAYKDFALTAGQEHPFPIPSDAWGRLPIFWLADGNYAFRLVDVNGTILASSLNVQALGPSSGDGGGGSTVDPNALFQTGDVLWQDVSGTRSGFVRDNGRTIGSATSGATERANSDVLALYTFLYNNFSNSICPVTGGRGLSAAADFSANKPIQLPDKRFRTPIGLDDMGNSAAGRASGVPFSLGDELTAGSLGGEAIHVLSLAESAAHDHGGVTGNNSANPSFTWGSASYGDTGAGSPTPVLVDITASGLVHSVTVTGNHTHGLSSAGGSQAHNNIPLVVTGTFYRKL